MAHSRHATLLLGLLPVYLATVPAVAQTVEIGPLSVSAARADGRYVGFDVVADGTLVAPVRLSSNELITAARAEQTPDGGLRLSGLRTKAGTGLQLGADDFVQIAPVAGDRWPRVTFSMTVVAFDPTQWERGAGQFPLHFLVTSMPAADVFHQRGWLMATPKADPFPLLEDVHVGSPEVASGWSRNWSYAPPIGAYPVPVIGLWAPQDRLYVGYDFQEARLTDHSEKYIATAYCWQEGSDRQFVALVYPYAGRGFQTLTYPEPGSKIASHCRLVYSTQLPSTADPNAMLQEWYFATFTDRLPRVPEVNDMSWMAGGTRLREWWQAPNARVVYRIGEGSTYEEPGTVVAGHWGFHRGPAVDVAFGQPSVWPRRYRPLISVREDGGSLGEAAAYLRIPSGPAERGRLLYVWYRLLDDPQVGATIVRGVFGHVSDLVGGQWERVALLPNSPGGVALAYARAQGFADRIAWLTREQIVDPDAFNAERFPVLLDLGDESYPRTVKQENDGKRALVRYLAGGGEIVFMMTHPFPFYLGADEGLQQPDPLLPALGVPVASLFEEPGGRQLEYALEDGTGLLEGLPQRFAFPTEGDLRLRTIQIGGETALTGLREQLAYLMENAKRVTIAGEECVFWDKPVEGKWRDDWGGEPVRTMHNTDGWAPGIAFVDMYRRLGAEEYLPIIDGVYNWTKQFVWTRNEFADVPSSPFAIGGTLSVGFLLDYHFTFLSDPERGQKAQEALDLARSVAYRYYPVWASDNDEDDNVDASFLLEPNSGRDWAGAACANEVHWVLDTMTMAYVNTGDPIMEYYLRGALERWPRLYKDEYHATLAEYPRSSMSEWLGFFDGTMAGRGGRATFGTGDILPFHYPIGDSLLRVTCGEAAAFACNKNGVHTFARDYRYGPVGNFSFRVETRLDQPLDASITFPYVDISQKSVLVLRRGQAQPLSPEVGRPRQSPWSLYVPGLRDGDVVQVGSLPAEPRPGAGTLGLTQRAITPAERRVGEHELADLPYDTTLSEDWHDTASWAGLPSGVRWAYGLPYYIPPRVTGAEKTAAASPVRLEGLAEARALAVFYGPTGDALAAGVQVAFDGGRRVDIRPEESAVAWYAWPPCFDRLILAAIVPVPAGERAVAVTANNAYLFAVTLSRADASREVQLLAQGNAAWRRQLAVRRELLDPLREVTEALPQGRLAIIPPTQNGPAAALAAIAKTGLRDKCLVLREDEFVDPAALDADRTPVALCMDGEGYVHTVREDGDGAEAYRRYLRQGGTLVLLAGQPYPMFYPIIGGQQQTGPNVQQLLPDLGLRLRVTWEQPPEGTTIAVHIDPNQDILKGLPATIPWPEQVDQRLRSLWLADVPEAATVTPIAEVRDNTGASHGLAALLLEHVTGEFRGGRILYVWSGLLADPEHGAKVAFEALNWAVGEAVAR